MLKTGIATLLLVLAPAVLAQDGTIDGVISYPSEEIPPLRIHALTADGKSAGSVSTQLNQRKFRIRGLPAGSYRVVAYFVNKADGGDMEAGGWTRYVTCGMKVGCTDHSLIPVAVAAGQRGVEVHVGDWAGRGTFPPEPGTPMASADCSTRGSQLEQDACNLKAYEAADRALNEEYRRVMNALSKQPKCQERLREAQRAWVRFRDEHCKFEGAIGYKGRTTECLGEVTAQRAGYLKQQTDLETCGP